MLQSLEDLAIFLLVQSVHRLEPVRETAIAVLPTLFARVPHLVWSDRLLSVALDLNAELHQRLDVFTVVGVNQSVTLPYPPYQLVIPSLLTERSAIFENYEKR